MGNFNIKINHRLSEGSYVCEEGTNRYILDMLNSYSSLPLGYNHPALRSEIFLNEVLEVCAQKIALGEYDSPHKREFEKEFREFALPSGDFDFLHFACTGALAVEAAIKTAWHHHRGDRSKVIVIKNSFHGVNGYGSFLTTRFDSRLEDVPFAEWVTCVTINGGYIEDMFSFPKNFEHVAAVIVEPIQCTYGDYHMQHDMLRKLREFCNKSGAVLITDEVQTGFCTTGSKWYSITIEDFTPDIIVFGKKAQVSGIMVRKGYDRIMNEPEKLSVTYDGDLIDMIRAKHIIRAIKNENLLTNIWNRGLELKNGLESIPGIRNVRGIGGLVAFDLDTANQRDSLYINAFQNGLMINPTGKKSIRLRPHLAVTQLTIGKTLSIIEATMKQINP